MHSRGVLHIALQSCSLQGCQGTGTFKSSAAEAGVTTPGAACETVERLLVRNARRKIPKVPFRGNNCIVYLLVDANKLLDMVLQYNGEVAS